MTTRCGCRLPRHIAVEFLTSPLQLPLTVDEPPNLADAGLLRPDAWPRVRRLLGIRHGRGARGVTSTTDCRLTTRACAQPGSMSGVRSSWPGTDAAIGPSRSTPQNSPELRESSCTAIPPTMGTRAGSPGRTVRGAPTPASTRQREVQLVLAPVTRLSPGFAATADAPGPRPSAVPTLPRIPAVVLAYRRPRRSCPALRVLPGPSGFQGGLPFTYRLGSDSVKVKLDVQMDAGRRRHSS